MSFSKALPLNMSQALSPSFGVRCCPAKQPTPAKVTLAMTRMLESTKRQTRLTAWRRLSKTAFCLPLNRFLISCTQNHHPHSHASCSSPLILSKHDASAASGKREHTALIACHTAAHYGARARSWHKFHFTKHKHHHRAQSRPFHPLIFHFIRLQYHDAAG